jgi:ABC-type polysaccharide/polyol phosphate transport system ATPase subunit
MTEHPVSVEHLWQAYRPKTRNGRRRHGPQIWALSDITLSVARGETLGIVGGNGSGKTTLLRSINGVLRPTRGRVVTRGRVSPLVDLEAGVHRDLTGRENLVLSGALLGMRRAEIADRRDEISEFAGLSETMLDSPLRTYSSGMTLRLGFALIAHSRPSVLLVDEVLAVGDETFQQKCLAKVADLRDAGCAIVIVSHDLELCAELCQRIGVLARGHLKYVGTPAGALEVYRETRAASDIDIAGAV